MRSHLNTLLSFHKQQLDQERVKLLGERQQGIDIDHSLHHGGTALERAKKHAQGQVLRGLDDCYGSDYPDSEEMREIRLQMDIW